jgi:hypothetical protein
MTVTVELPPEIEAVLAAQAAAQGLALPDYILHLLEERLPARAGALLSPTQRADAWRASTRGLPIRPPLSDAAIGRDSIYDARG